MQDWNSFRNFIGDYMSIKKLLLMVFLSPAFCLGANTSLEVSSGTFLAVDGFSPANTNFRQAVTVADPNVTGGVAPVDPVTGLAVHLATSSVVSNTYQINPSTVTVIGSTVGINGTIPVSGTFFQANQPVTVIASTVGINGTVPVSGTFFQTVQPVYENRIATETVVASTVGVVGTVGISQSTFGVVNGGSVFQIGNSTIAISNSITVQLSTAGVGGSTTAITNAVGTFLQVANSTVGVTGNVTVVASTVGIVGNVTVVASTVGATQQGTWVLPTSTVGVVNGGTVFTIGNSTISVAPHQIINSTMAVVGTLADNAASTTTNRIGTLPGAYQDAYGNGVPGTIGKDAVLEVLSDHGLHVAELPAIIPDSYSGSTTTFSVATDTSDVAALCGNPTSLVMIYSIRASCTQTTAGNVQLAVVKRSSAYVGVWSSMTVVPQDSNYEVPGSTAIFFTTLPNAPGTLVGYLDVYKLGCMAAGTATPNDIYISPSDWKMKPIVLRGTSQCVGLNIQNATITGGAMTATFNWLEIPTISP
jgi:hypothetical protein